MKRRFAISLLTVFALLWQGAASAAMMPMFAASNSTATQPCHRQHEGKQAGHSVVMKTCCADVQCHCATACSASALPVTAQMLGVIPSALPAASVVIAGFVAAAPPHPFRPPISRFV